MQQTRKRTAASGGPQPNGAAAAGTAADAPAPAEEPSGPEVRVLIVEDEWLVSTLLADLVEDAGFAPVGRAATAQEALRIARAERPDIALVDVNLRGAREGVQAGAELARMGVALIFISGHADVAEWPDVQALEPVAVLQKPCLPARVIEALKAAAARRSEGCRRPG